MSVLTPQNFQLFDTSKGCRYYILPLNFAVNAVYADNSDGHIADQPKEVILKVVISVPGDKKDQDTPRGLTVYLVLESWLSRKEFAEIRDTPMASMIVDDTVSAIINDFKDCYNECQYHDSVHVDLQRHRRIWECKFSQIASNFVSVGLDWKLYRLPTLNYLERLEELK